ncbi:Lipoxygenase [Stipitochalara longipes BDJ]|nr:Lipoxygenase [Stipitochalara longipes BDJ]
MEVVTTPVIVPVAESKEPIIEVVPANTPLASETLKLGSWDPNVFASDILETQAGIKKNYEQTSKGLTVAYGKIMSSIQSYFDVAEFEPSLAPKRLLEDKKKQYQWSTAGGYPPHLDLVPKIDSATKEEMFAQDAVGEREFAVVLRAIIRKKSQIAGSVFEFVRPGPSDVAAFSASSNFLEIMTKHNDVRKGGTSKPSVGDLQTAGMAWYSDAIFAQQNFTGTNPTTIQLAERWISRFQGEATRQKLDKMEALLKEADESSLYVQDYSYFREAFGIKNAKAEMSDKGGWFKDSRWACAAVTLFQLDAEGTLHPLAIVIDYRGSMADSVVIFNKRLTAAEKDHNQEQDWPWRYAKTCSQVSDWIRHELAIHLTNTHLIEEPIIVASQRTLPSNHPLYKILSPHWDKTLSLNASARQTLVPSVVIPIIGASAQEATNFINFSYNSFDFVGNYIPADLERRGFPLDKLGDLCCRCAKHCDNEKNPGEDCKAGCGPECHQQCDPKFRNYTYARNMKLMWTTLRNFISGYITTHGYTNDSTGDKKVFEDTYIADWVNEIRSTQGANIKTFPDIKTVNQLIDAVTMCIHIASPQHTAVNYLQQFYLSFVVNKPPALCEAPPTSLTALEAYKEKDLIKALPVARDRDAEWLLASHLPALLSQTVTKDLNLVAYAVNVYSAAKLVDDKALMKVAELFCRELWVLGNTFSADDKTRSPKIGVFTQHSDELTPGFPKYTVMDPVVTAVSVLI